MILGACILALVWKYRTKRMIPVDLAHTHHYSSDCLGSLGDQELGSLPEHGEEAADHAALLPLGSANDTNSDSASPSPLAVVEPVPGQKTDDAEPLKE
eukprot:gene1493-436_t